MAKDTQKITKGRVINIEDSEQESLAGLNLYGKTTQCTTTGAQLANLPDKPEKTVGGITWSCKNGAVTAKGTATVNSASGNAGILYVFTGAVGTFHINKGANDVELYVRIDKDGTSTYASNRSFTLDGTETLAQLFLQVGAGKTVDATIYPMLNEGTTALPWEPYTGGKASPSTDYPQELESVGDGGSVGVTVAGKNLIPFPYAETNIEDGVKEEGGCRFEIKTDGGIVCSGTATAYGAFTIENYIPFDFDVTYWLNNDVQNVATDIALRDANGNIVASLQLGAQKRTQTILKSDYPTASFIGISIKRAGNGLTLSGTAYPMLVAGTEAPTEYEPYKPIQTLTAQTPNGLPGIPVTDASLATYTDESGQMWCADVKDYGLGKKTQAVYPLTFDGSDDEDWILVNSNANGITTFQVSAGIAHTSNRGLSNYGLLQPNVTSSTVTDEGFRPNGAYIYLYTETSDLSTLDDLKSRLAESNMVVYVVLTTPIETDIDPEELAAYEALHTQESNTTVYNDADAYMEVNYYTTKKLLCDVETYRCDANGKKDPKGRYIFVKASSPVDDRSVFVSFQISENYGLFEEPKFLENGVGQIIGDGSIDPKKMYHVCYAASDANQTVYKAITLYINAHRAELGYMGGGFGIEPPNIDDGYYFNGNIKVPVYDDSGNIVNWRIL